MSAINGLGRCLCPLVSILFGQRWLPCGVVCGSAWRVAPDAVCYHGANAEISRLGYGAARLNGTFQDAEFGWHILRIHDRRHGIDCFPQQAPFSSLSTNMRRLR